MEVPYIQFDLEDVKASVNNIQPVELKDLIVIEEANIPIEHFSNWETASVFFKAQEVASANINERVIIEQEIIKSLNEKYWPNIFHLLPSGSNGILTHEVDHYQILAELRPIIRDRDVPIAMTLVRGVDDDHIYQITGQLFDVRYEVASLSLLEQIAVLLAPAVLGEGDKLGVMFCLDQLENLGLLTREILQEVRSNVDGKLLCTLEGIVLVQFSDLISNFPKAI